MIEFHEAFAGQARATPARHHTATPPLPPPPPPLHAPPLTRPAAAVQILSNLTALDSDKFFADNLSQPKVGAVPMEKFNIHGGCSRSATRSAPPARG